MKSLGSFVLVALLAALGAAILPSSNVAYAAFHCMRIHAVMAGYNGNGNIQYVELRMNTGGQTVLGGHTIEFYDSSNTLKARFTFPSGVTNGLLGESILIGTEAFRDNTPGPGGPDFVFLGPGDPDGPQNTVVFNGGLVSHPIQAPGGLVHFAPGSANCDTVMLPVPAGEVDSVAYGAAASYYPPAATALPSPATTKALRLNVALGTAFPPPDGVNNSTEYGLYDVATADATVPSGSVRTDLTTPRNNARQVLQIVQSVPSVGGVAEAPAGARAPDAVVADDSTGRGWGMPLMLALASVVVVATGGGLVARHLRARRDYER
jgi:hypothetical protein